MKISGENLLFLIEISKVIRVAAERKGITEENAEDSTLELDDILFRDTNDYNFIYNLANNHPVALEKQKNNGYSKILINKSFDIDDIVEYYKINKAKLIKEINERYTERIPISKTNQIKIRIPELKEFAFLHSERLLYWITHSQIIRIYAESKGITEENALDSKMKVTRENFFFYNGDIDWLLLTDLLEFRKIGTFSGDSKIFKNNYTRQQVEELLDYIGFMTPDTMWDEITAKFLSPVLNDNRNRNRYRYRNRNINTNANTNSYTKKNKNNNNINLVEGNNALARSDAAKNAYNEIEREKHMSPNRGSKAPGLRLRNFMKQTRRSKRRSTSRSKTRKSKTRRHRAKANYNINFI